MFFQLAICLPILFRAIKNKHKQTIKKKTKKHTTKVKGNNSVQRENKGFRNEQAWLLLQSPSAHLTCLESVSSFDVQG